ncbi:MAG: calcium-binding protein [Ruminococcus sp.]|uniref:calcium-binding protein n=1 Tax=Ruminococcus sp. TaxID=41978 RepID=UPI0025DE653B|nr:calcium-binding protein [Ruminococcus sp.]MBR6995407.1 calcium-binding protein [Ruminococcus sp.]
MADYTNVTEEDIKKWGKDKIKDKVVDDTLKKIEDKYGDEFETLGITGDSIKTLYGYASGGGMTDDSISSELDLIYDLINDTDAFGDFKDTQSFRNIGKLKTGWATYGSDLKTLKKSMDTMSGQLEAYGRYDADGVDAMEDALNSIMNISKGAMNNTIAGPVYGSVIDNTMGVVDDGIKIVKGAALERDINYYAMDPDDPINDIIEKMKDVDGFGEPSDDWANGPSLEELKYVYDHDSSSHNVIFNRYLRWRTQYEYDQTLREIERKTGQSFYDYRTPGQKIKDAYHERYDMGDAFKAFVSEYKDCRQIGKDAINGWMESAAINFAENWLAGGGDKVVDFVKAYRDDWLIGKEMLSGGFDKWLDTWTVGAEQVVGWENSALENWYYGAEEIYDNWKVGSKAIKNGFNNWLDTWTIGAEQIVGMENAAIEGIGKGISGYAEDWMVGADAIGDFFSDRYSDWKAGWKDIMGFFGRNRNDISDASKMRYDPLIIDVDGDGFTIESKENGANFDLDGNNYAEKINWTKKDGYLCLDLNKNGKIDSGRELFGDSTFIGENGELAKNGFEALAQYDENGDGVIDSGDEIFSNLRVWVDADGNGASEGELRTLEELGITAINLNYTTGTDEATGEAHIADIANVVYADGTMNQIGELWVSADLFDTIDNSDVAISEDIAALPDVRGFGNVSSLHAAMANDESGELKALVESFIGEADTKARRNYVSDILFRLCGVEDIAANSRGNNIDARKLSVIEKVMGESYVGVNGSNPNPTAAARLNEVYANIENMYYNLLNSETTLKPFIALLEETVDANGNRVIKTDALQKVLDVLYDKGYENADNDLYAISSYLKFMNDSGVQGYKRFTLNNFMKGRENLFTEEGTILHVDDEGIAAGTNSSEMILGSEENDVITGGGGDDMIVAGKGDDVLRGGHGNDTYVFGLGDGNDVIDEANASTAADTILFGEGITAEDVRVTRDGHDMVLFVGDNGDSLRIVNQYYDSWYHIENFEFADGTVLTKEDLFNTSLVINGEGVIKDEDSGYGTRNNSLIGSEGADSIYGYSGDDTLTGGAGNDTLYGGTGSDTYIFNSGDGADIINESNANSAKDRVVFGEGITPDDITVTRDDKDMVLYIGDNGDSIRIVNQYYDSWYQVENFEFADGTVITKNELFDNGLIIRGEGVISDYDSGYGSRNNTLIGSDEADTISAYGGDDVLIGGKGSDTLYGGTGSDTYIFNSGDGADIINESNANSANDRVVFGEGITPDDLKVTRDGNDMVLYIGEDGDSIRIINQYYDSWYQVENFEFADGTVITKKELFDNGLVVNGSGVIKDYDSGYGSRNNTLIGSKGDDTISAYGGDDVLIGGEGDDTLYGGTGSDTYIFNAGDGADIINESNANSANDRIVFGEGITPDDLKVTRDGNDMVLYIGEDGDSIRIINQYYDSWYQVENFEFADGTVITKKELFDNGLIVNGEGKFGDYDSGYGSRNNTLIGSKGDDTISAYGGDDVLIGGEGNDTLIGGTGSDTYIFNPGDGIDVINENNGNSANDKIVFGKGITADDIIVTRDGKDMVLLVGSDGDSIRIVNQYYDSWYQVEKLEFADGKVITKEELFNNALIIRGTGEFGDHDSGYGTRNNTLIGSDEADIISAYSGDDTIIGGEGNDTLYGGTGSDTYIFNPGDGADIINESNANSANDRIVFGEGISPEDVTVTRDGNDMVLLVGPDGDSIRIINQYYDSWYQVENFEFADGTVITKNELFDNGLVVNGSGVIKDYDSGYGSRNNTLVGAKGEDTIYGYGGDDTLIGGEGNDTLIGGAGSDTYIFNPGDGADIVNENNGNSAKDRIVFGKGITPENIKVTRDGNDMVLYIGEDGDSIRIINQYYDSWYQVENFEFADGTVITKNELFDNGLIINGEGEFSDYDSGYGSRNNTLIGSDGADTISAFGGDDVLIGGAGDDTLIGGTGSDTYIFNAGDGVDIINENNGNSAKDRVVFGEGIRPSDVTVTRDGKDMVLLVGPDGDSVRIVNQYYDSWYQVESVEFADGTILTKEDLFNTSLVINGEGVIKDEDSGYGTRNNILIGSDGEDTIYGYGGDDTLTGGAGNDTLVGGGGTDTYIFNAGDGADIINESNGNSANDRVVFGEGISIDDITITRDDHDMVLSIGSDGDSIRIINQYYDSWYRIESFEFADGTVAHIDLGTSEFVIDVQGTVAEVEQTFTEYLSNIYSDEMFGGELTVENTVIADVNDSVSIGEESNDISDIANIQAMVLAENMSAFSNDSQVSDGINISEITADASGLEQLLVSSTVQ